MGLDKLRIYIRPEYAYQIAYASLYNQPVPFTFDTDGSQVWVDLYDLGIAPQVPGTVMDLKVGQLSGVAHAGASREKCVWVGGARGGRASAPGASSSRTSR